MTHAEFVSAYNAGALRVRIDPQLASRYVSARLLLPLMVLPVLGIGVALGMVLPRLIRRMAPHFLLTQALQDEKLYRELLAAAVISIDA